MTETWKSRVALFFSFTLVDEALSIAAMKETLLSIGRRFPKSDASDAQLVASCMRYYKKYQKKRAHLEFKNSIFAKSSESEFREWLQFAERCNSETLTTLVFSKILKISDADISAGIQQSEGVIRYRISHSLHQLGASLRLQK